MATGISLTTSINISSMHNCTNPTGKEALAVCLELSGDILRFTSQESKNIFMAVQMFFILVVLCTNGVVMMLYVVDKTLRTPYNLYILSVLVADMCAGLFAIPAAMLIHIKSGNEMCQSFGFFLSLIEAADVYTMVLIAGEKYLRLVLKPTIQRTLGVTAASIGTVWILSLLYSMKDAVVYESYRETHWDGEKVLYHTECRIPPQQDKVVKAFVLSDALLLFFLPLMTICACYASITHNLNKRPKHEVGMAQNRRAVRLHMTVVGMFFCTAIGLHILRLHLTFGSGPFPNDSFSQDILTTVAFSDFWINPLLYCYFNTNFRSSWVKLCGGHALGNGTATVTPSDNPLPNLEELELPKISPVQSRQSIQGRKRDSQDVYSVA